MHESLTRAVIASRVADTEQRRLGNRVAHARRLHRKAARAAVRARRLNRLAAQAERRATPLVRPRTS